MRVTVTVDPGAGFRTTRIHLASTVTDPGRMSAKESGSLYLDRWKVELFIDDLKTTLGMAVLTSRSPAMIRRELIVRIIAYNLLRALMNCGKTAGKPRDAGTRVSRGPSTGSTTGCRLSSRQAPQNSASDWSPT
jgi:Transposase DDE domain